MRGTRKDALKLAEQLKLLQETEVKERVSLNNVVEILQKLLEKRLVDAVYSEDGKEIITLASLKQEISSELKNNSGRISITELSGALNVSASHTENAIREVIKEETSGSIQSFCGEIIHSSYIDRIISECNEMLHDKGSINFQEVSTHFSLPFEFIKSEIFKAQKNGRLHGIFLKQRPDCLVSERMISRNKDLVKAALCAVTCPMTITELSQTHQLSRAEFKAEIQKMLSNATLSGYLLSDTFYPAVYNDSLRRSIECRLKADGFLLYSFVHGLGISDPMSYINSLGESSDVGYHLCSAYVSRGCVISFSVSLEYMLKSEGILYPYNVINSNFTNEDLIKLIEISFKTISSFSEFKSFTEACHFFEDTGVLMSLTLINKVYQLLVKALNEYMKENHDDILKQALKATAENESIQEASESQNRSKPVKSGKKSRKCQDFDKSNNREKQINPSASISLPISSLKNMINNHLDLNEEELDAVLSHLNDKLRTQFDNNVARLLGENDTNRMKMSQSQSQTSGLSTINHSLLSQRIFSLLNLYEGSMTSISNSSLQEDMQEYLLKSLGKDLTNILFKAVVIYHTDKLLKTSASDVCKKLNTNDPLSPSDLSSCFEILEKNQSNVLQELLNLHLTEKTLNGFIFKFLTYADFLQKFANISVSVPKKTQLKELFMECRWDLYNQLDNLNFSNCLSTDYAPATLLFFTLIFQNVTQLCVRIPGKLIPRFSLELYDVLAKHHHTDLIDLLKQCQDVVIRLSQMKSKKSTETMECEQIDCFVKVKEYICEKFPR